MLVNQKMLYVIYIIAINMQETLNIKGALSTIIYPIPACGPLGVSQGTITPSQGLQVSTVTLRKKAPVCSLLTFLKHWEGSGSLKSLNVLIWLKYMKNLTPYLEELLNWKNEKPYDPLIMYQGSFFIMKLFKALVELERKKPWMPYLRTGGLSSLPVLHLLLSLLLPNMHPILHY